MSANENQNTIKQYAEEVWNGGNLAAIEQYIAPNYTRHQPGLPMPIEGPDAVRQLVAMYRNAFPDIHFTREVMVADEDKVAVQWRVQATHGGDLMGIPATQKPVDIKASEIFRLSGGKIVEQWVLVDSLSMLQQMGVVPAPG